MRSFLFCGVTAAALAAPALAKLPGLDEAGKAKAAETAARTAWTEKVGLYKHCQALDRVAAHYRKTAKDAAPPVTTAPCEDPGTFVYTPVAAKPLEAAGAHSPAGTAVSPPSTTAPAGAAPAVAKGTAVTPSPPSTTAPAGAAPAVAKGTAVTPVKDKPIEAAEAHSPPGTAISPPSTKETAKDLGTGKK